MTTFSNLDNLTKQRLTALAIGTVGGVNQALTQMIANNPNIPANERANVFADAVVAATPLRQGMTHGTQKTTKNVKNAQIRMMIILNVCLFVCYRCYCSRCWYSNCTSNCI